MKIPYPICWKGCFSPQRTTTVSFVITGKFLSVIRSSHPNIHAVDSPSSFDLVDIDHSYWLPHWNVGSWAPHIGGQPQQNDETVGKAMKHLFHGRLKKFSEKRFRFQIVVLFLSRFISEFHVQRMDRLGIDQGDQQSQKKVISELKKITSTVQHSTCGCFSVRQGATWVVVDLCWRSSVEGICAYLDLGIPGDSKVWIEIPERNPNPNPSIGSGPCIKILMIHHGMSDFFSTLRGLHTKIRSVLYRSCASLKHIQNIIQLTTTIPRQSSTIVLCSQQNWLFVAVSGFFVAELSDSKVHSVHSLLVQALEHVDER